MFADLITRMCSAAVRGDGAAVAACFTPDGIYHDVFYGSFRGAEIADMIENYFHRDATNFKWDLHDPVEYGGIGYVRYVFSYESRLEASKGTRAIFEGVAVCRISNGLLDEYREVANAATGLHCVGFSADRLARFVGKQCDELKTRPESVGHT
ncbi:MAG TPA: nuclear transport factor 2 family protein [Hyphomicrobiaceae bacterium]|nr:nuclear transport factor 2 family protein [Hyphomicrobiaceae bacterium]